ncbi:hypothetical protein OESDEN_09682 [Oesophagostomum dentatum]|uniref:Uncharacterized protein n=1 Tax=Oesophagostomum dentatum TaxID=61180 RepID=A0A0B1T2T9_OESDE|nr:hypothetical protein OESDEN_09682 [Oesophagostomum dentatum]
MNICWDFARRTGAKRVLHQLSDANKATVAIAGILLRRSKNSGFFDSIVTSDRKWICFDNATRKRQWLDAGDTPKPTPKPDIHGKKVMLCLVEQQRFGVL